MFLLVAKRVKFGYLKKITLYLPKYRRIIIFQRYFLGCFRFGKRKNIKEESDENLSSVIRRKYENLGPTTYKKYTCLIKLILLN